MPPCKNCQDKFAIHPQDKKFYERIPLPEPENCPECRFKQRAVWRNEYILYQRKCNLCEKNIISVYSPDKPYKVYCHECWWSDKWDGLSYDRDYDFSRGFFEQFGELMKEVPRLTINNTNSVNSEYTHHCSRNKNCYLQFAGSTDCEDCLYGWSLFYSKDSLDMAFCSKTELCYQCIDSDNIYNCSYLEYSHDCTDCNFCYNCAGCKNCFGCINLRNEENYLWNKKVQPQEIEEYKKKLQTYAEVKRVNNEFQDRKAHAIVNYAHNLKVINTTGDYVRNIKNGHDVYDIIEAEDCGYIINGSKIKDAYDCTGFGGLPAEFGYQCVSTGRGTFGTFFCSLVWDSSHIWYSDTIFGCQEIFGCVGLKNNKKYCIFNKQYSESEYKELREKIIAQMKKNDEWAKFFPYSLAPYGYNETRAQLEKPLTQEEALKLGAK